MNQFVSILVPVYGVEKYIERCARSLFEQTYEAIEYIFVDDCSPDRSIEILKQVIDDYPQRKPHVRIIRHEHNRGLAAVRNTAVEDCHTGFLMHVDSDDYIELNTIALCMEKQQEYDYDIVTFDMVKHFKHYDEQWNQMEVTSPKDFTVKLLDGRCAHGVCGNLIRTCLYSDNDIKAIEGVNMAEDYYVMPRLAYHAKRVVNLHRTLYHYCFENANSYAFTFSRAKSEQQMRVLDELLKYFSNEPDCFHILQLEFLRILFDITKKTIVSGDKDYYRFIREKIKDYPISLLNNISVGDRIALFFGPTIVGKYYVEIAYKLKSFWRWLKGHKRQWGK